MCELHTPFYGYIPINFSLALFFNSKCIYVLLYNLKVLLMKKIKKILFCFTYEQINNLLQYIKCPETRSPRVFRISHEYVIVHPSNGTRAGASEFVYTYEHVTSNRSSNK